MLAKAKTVVAAIPIALFAAAPALAAKTGQPEPWQLNFQPAASPVMANIESFHTLLLYIITAISLFVLGLLLWIMARYNLRANPTPSKTEHNTLLEVLWTVVPVIILVIIAIPSFKLLYYEADIPKPDLTIEAIGGERRGAGIVGVDPDPGTEAIGPPAPVGDVVSMGEQHMVDIGGIYLRRHKIA